MFETHKYTAMSTAILCLAVHVFDIMNKAGMWGVSICYVMSPFFFCCSVEKSEPAWLQPEKPQFKAPKSTYVAWIWIEPPYRSCSPANRNVCPFSIFSGQLTFLLGVPFEGKVVLVTGKAVIFSRHFHCSPFCVHYTCSPVDSSVMCISTYTMFICNTSGHCSYGYRNSSQSSWMSVCWLGALRVDLGDCSLTGESPRSVCKCDWTLPL